MLRRGCLLGDFTAKMFGCDDVATNLRICKFLKETLNFGTCFQKITSIRTVASPPYCKKGWGERAGRWLLQPKMPIVIAIGIVLYDRF